MNHDGKIDINKLLKQMENSKELYQKINKLQKEKNNLKMEVNEQNNYINNILNCNKKEISKNNNDKEELEEFKAGLITILDNSIKNTEGMPMQNELLKIYKYINNNKKDNSNINANEKIKNNGENASKLYDEKINIIKKNSNIDISNNNINNSNMNNNNINNFLSHKKSMSSVNTNKYNSIKGISFTPYIQKPNNQNNNQKDDNNNFKEVNYYENNNNNINKKNINLQYLTEKNRINIDQRLKNKKYINKFINSNA